MDYCRTSKKQNIFIGYETVQENWTTLNWNGILIPRYLVSDYGRLFDTLYNMYVSCSLDKDGYMMASIHIGRNDFGCPYKKIRLHRFILMSFNYVPGCEKLIANHKDGNKLNIALYNLEWTTDLGNTQHGWETGLNKNIGTKNGNGKYDETTVIKICELIEAGLTNSEICNKFNITETSERARFCSTISGIRDRKTHKYISCKYRFANGAKDIYRHNLEEAHIVCSLLSDPNKIYSYNEIMEKLNIPENERADYKVYINDLIRGRTAKSVTSQYNIRKPIN